MKLDRRSFLRGGAALAAVSMSGASVAYASNHVPVPRIYHVDNVLHIDGDGATINDIYSYMMDLLRSDVDMDLTP